MTISRITGTAMPALFLSALASLSVAACSSSPTFDDFMHAGIGDRTYAISGFDNTVQSDEQGVRVRLMGRVGGSCAVSGDSSTFTMRATISDLSAVALGSAMDPTDLPEGVHVELDAAHADCGYSGGTLSGTITFTALSTTHAEGSFDLRLDDTVNDCGAASPTTIVFSWDGFIAPDDAGDDC